MEQGFTVTTSRNFAQWLSDRRVSLAISTYQVGKLFLVGIGGDGNVAAFERTFDRVMGIGAFRDRRSFLLATRAQLIRFDEVLPKSKAYESWDVLYAPHQTWITGDLDVHDLAVAAGDAPVFVSTLYSCIATVSPGYSFKPLWWPPFISRIAPEDRCHLNGMALENGKPRFATLVAASDVGDGWRDRKVDGGMVWDIAEGKPIAQGLSMPHSPQLHEGKLWLLNSGKGELGFVERASGQFEPVAFCPGYARGLTIIDHYAVICLSLPREDRTFHGLPLDGALAARGAEPRCGLIVVDLETGDTIAWLRIENLVRELFDVGVLPGVRNPALIGFMTNEIQQTVSIDASELPKRS
jgi:uncharacterized protein (TIGR03032 family)